MSDTDAIVRIEQGLTKLLAAGHRVVWWSDPDAEFADAVQSLTFPTADVIAVSGAAALAIKRRVELESVERSVVLYEAEKAPAPESDWLLDIRRYAAPFAADATAMIQQDLGLRQASLRYHLKKRAAFLNSKDRFKRLAELIHPDDNELIIDAKIWSVLTKSASSDPFMLWVDVLSDLARLNDDEGYEQSAVWQKLVKFGLEEFVWASAGFHFGYADEEPSLQRFVPRLFVTDMAHRLKDKLPKALQALVLPANKASNVSVLLSTWRDSSTRQSDYDDLSERLSAELHLPQHLSALSTEAVASCDTFVDLERVVANALRDQLLGNLAESVFADVRSVVNSRLSSYWVTERIADTAVGRRSIWRGYYRALQSATDLFEAIETQAKRFSFANASLAYQAYTQSLFKIDQHYRLFHESADIVTGRYPNAIVSLADQVESAYLNSYLKKLASHWDDHLSNGLLDNWTIDGVGNQQGFYRSVVEPYFSTSDDRRMFVIISDALRYEVADELKSIINSQQSRVEATLTSQLGVLPSYTKLGMASLLPHKTLTYTEQGFVKADGASTDGLENRNKILSAVGGFAVQAETLANMSQNAMRELLYPHKVVYIYHNKIDAIGDSQSTESNTWAACRQAINEIADLVARLVNRVSATEIAITADHGFLFQETMPEALEKSAMATKPTGTVVHKKRYLIGKNLGAAEFAHHGKALISSGAEGDMEFWLPRGVGRFHFTGGARFVHGGAALQEVVVPIIRVKQRYKGFADKTRVRKVGVNVLGQQHRITTSFHSFTLLQTDAVSEKVRPASINVELVNQHDESVSSKISVTLDSENANLELRKSKVSLNLLAVAVKKQNEHFLVISDAETDVELQRTPVRIDLAIQNDFDF